MRLRARRSRTQPRAATRLSPSLRTRRIGPLCLRARRPSLARSVRATVGRRRLLRSGGKRGRRRLRVSPLRSGRAPGCGDGRLHPGGAHGRRGQVPARNVAHSFGRPRLLRIPGRDVSPRKQPLCKRVHAIPRMPRRDPSRRRFMSPCRRLQSGRAARRCRLMGGRRPRDRRRFRIGGRLPAVHATALAFPWRAPAGGDGSYPSARSYPGSRRDSALCGRRRARCRRPASVSGCNRRRRRLRQWSSRAFAERWRRGDHRRPYAVRDLPLRHRGRTTLGFGRGGGRQGMSDEVCGSGRLPPT